MLTAVVVLHRNAADAQNIADSLRAIDTEVFVITDIDDNAENIQLVRPSTTPAGPSPVSPTEQPAGPKASEDENEEDEDEDGDEDGEDEDED